MLPTDLPEDPTFFTLSEPGVVKLVVIPLLILGFGCRSPYSRADATTAGMDEPGAAALPVEDFENKVLVPLLDGGQFGAAARYLGPTDYIGSSAFSGRCRAFTGLFSRLETTLRASGFRRDYEVLTASIVENDLKECTSFVRDTRKDEYLQREPRAPPLDDETSSVRDIARVCVQAALAMDLCSYTVATFVARWGESRERRRPFVDEHRDLLIVELLAVVHDTWKVHS